MSIVVIAVGYYIIDTYGNEIYSKIKISTIDFIFNDIDSYEIVDDKGSRKLKILIDEYFEKIKEQDLSETYDKARIFFNEIKMFLEDNKISDIEFDKLNKIINDERK